MWLKVFMQQDFNHVLDACTAAIKSGHKILFFGNGGSASDAQHLATELTVRFINNRAPIAALALTTDTSTLTAAGNDFGFDHILPGHQCDTHRSEQYETRSQWSIGRRAVCSGNNETVCLAHKKSSQRANQCTARLFPDGVVVSQ